MSYVDLIVDPSPWPLVAALGVFFQLLVKCFIVHNYEGGDEILCFGVGTFLHVMYTRWRDIIRQVFLLSPGKSASPSEERAAFRTSILCSPSRVRFVRRQNYLSYTLTVEC